MKKIKDVLGKFFGHPVVRGIIKTLPVGNWVYEVAENMKHAKTGEIDPVKAADALLAKPHSPVSLLVQLVGLLVIVWAFVTHQITVEQVLRFLSFSDNLDPVSLERGVMDSLKTFLK